VYAELQAEAARVGISLLASKRRSQELTDEAYAQVMQDFIRDASVTYQVLSVEQRVITRGGPDCCS
jgi:hypothetical protein